MKTVILCLFALALVAHADDFVGKFYAPLGSNSYCSPVGPVTIAKKEGTTNYTVELKYDPYSAQCRAVNLAGFTLNLEAPVTDNTLALVLPPKNGIIIPVNIKKTGDKYTIASPGQMMMPEVPETDLIPLTADLEAKMKSFEGKYTFALTSGNADECCFPDEFELNEKEANVFYNTGKYGNSAGCVAQKLSGAEWYETTTIVSNDGFKWLQKLTGSPTTYADLSIVNGKFVVKGKDTCVITATKGAGPTPPGPLPPGPPTPPGPDDGSGSIFGKWYFWVIIILIAVGAGGAYFYMRNKKQQENRQALNAGYNYA